MESSFKTQGRWLVLDTSLGADKFLLERLKGREAISELFHFSLSALSEDPDIPPTDLIGSPVFISVGLESESVRRFHGMVSAIERLGGRAQGLTHYAIEVSPHFWLATLNRNSRIFQGMTIPEIIKEVLITYSGLQFDLNCVVKIYEKQEYIVQYRESDFNFLSRIMEKYGIFYFFIFDESGHKIVLADEAAAAFTATPDAAMRRRADGGFSDAITRWSRTWRYQPIRWSHRDFNFERPRTDLTTTVNSTNSVDVPTEAPHPYEIFDYPGGYRNHDGGVALAETRILDFESRYELALGEGSNRQFRAGGLFTLAEGDNGQTSEWALITVEHNVAMEVTVASSDNSSGMDLYSNRFTAVPAVTRFAPSRITPTPTISGPQTAFVVGPPGEEIHTDRYGRIKVRFHWDRAKTPDDRASCWIRVTQSWAGRGWGSFFLPRVGMEVLVEFLEGDPDRPIVTGAIHNADAMPTFQLPQDKTRSGFRTHSMPSQSEKEVNELRFEDKRGQEHIYLHAQRDLLRRVENDARTQIAGSDHLTVGGDQYTKIGGSAHVTLNADLRLQIKDKWSVIVNGPVDQSVDGPHSTYSGTGIVLEAPSIDLIAGASFIRLDASGIVIEGPMVYINSGNPVPESWIDPEAPTYPRSVEDTRTAQSGHRLRREPSPPSPAPKSRAPAAVVARQKATLKKAAAAGSAFVERCKP